MLHFSLISKASVIREIPSGSTKSIVCSVGQRVNKSICFDRSVDTMIHWPLSKEFPSPEMDIDKEDRIYDRPDCYNVLVDDAW